MMEQGDVIFTQRYDAETIFHGDISNDLFDELESFQEESADAGPLQGEFVVTVSFIPREA